MIKFKDQYDGVMKNNFCRRSGSRIEERNTGNRKSNCKKRLHQFQHVKEQWCATFIRVLAEAINLTPTRTIVSTASIVIPRWVQAFVPVLLYLQYRFSSFGHYWSCFVHRVVKSTNYIRYNFQHNPKKPKKMWVELVALASSVTDL